VLEGFRQCPAGAKILGHFKIAFGASELELFSILLYVIKNHELKMFLITFFFFCATVL
jgi:hypothetical protein